MSNCRCNLSLTVVISLMSLWRSVSKNDSSAGRVDIVGSLGSDSDSVVVKSTLVIVVTMWMCRSRNQIRVLLHHHTTCSSLSLLFKSMQHKTHNYTSKKQYQADG